jgi:hypothetical protein
MYTGESMRRKVLYVETFISTEREEKYKINKCIMKWCWKVKGVRRQRMARSVGHLFLKGIRGSLSCQGNILPGT